MGVRVLLIEDDETIAEPLADGLRHFGLTVHHVATGADGLRGPHGDVVLLDLGLPDMDGIDVCRGIRRTSDVPIIILSARGEEADRVLGLELGADDYLAKPFSIRELVARIRAVSRRHQRPGGGATGGARARAGPWAARWWPGSWWPRRASGGRPGPRTWPSPMERPSSSPWPGVRRTAAGRRPHRSPRRTGSRRPGPASGTGAGPGADSGPTTTSRRSGTSKPRTRIGQEQEQQARSEPQVEPETQVEPEEPAGPEG
ncbi:response regulator [Streptomyces sp. MNU76]|uniref:response regulator transcription factor n=1 Tax=Streptomyces sp. MNU76 TaxID=2560026 RepID=UPI001E4637B8|nr:response regulator transcription factor [Streptomyces sp. MNU76]MCC9704348.1 response regulator [Streptomyces sp. MNU76]